MVWAFLFKEQKNAGACLMKASTTMAAGDAFTIEDDFGQNGVFKSAAVHALLLEDLDLIEEARIQRSLAEARVRVKLDQRAKTDPVIRQAMNSQGPGVLTPVPRYS